MLDADGSGAKRMRRDRTAPCRRCSTWVWRLPRTTTMPWPETRRAAREDRAARRRSSDDR
jgi:hypothetical protein